MIVDKGREKETIVGDECSSGLAQVHNGRGITYKKGERLRLVRHVVPSIQSSPSVQKASMSPSPQISPFLPPANSLQFPPPTPLPLFPLSSPVMQAYHTPSDQRYPDPLANTAFWAPGGSDSSQPAVTRDSDDRHGPPRLRANQIPSAAAFGLTQRDSYPVQTQSDCSGQYPYPSQHYVPTVNYTAPPFDLAEYPVSNDIPLCRPL
jgi:hypothetical protein